MSRWLGPARCKGCRALVFYHPEHGWCERPDSRAVVKHVCPKVAA